MKFVLFYHSLVSDWNHGNAHFLRGIVRELMARGHEVALYEPADGWSRSHLLADHGERADRRVPGSVPGAPLDHLRSAEPRSRSCARGAPTWSSSTSGTRPSSWRGSAGTAPRAAATACCSTTRITAPCRRRTSCRRSSSMRSTASWRSAKWCGSCISDAAGRAAPGPGMRPPTYDFVDRSKVSGAKATSSGSATGATASAP